MLDPIRPDATAASAHALEEEVFVTTMLQKHTRLLDKAWFVILISFRAKQLPVDLEVFPCLLEAFSFHLRMYIRAPELNRNLSSRLSV